MLLVERLIYIDWLLILISTFLWANPPCEIAQFRYVEKQKNKMTSLNVCQEDEKLMSPDCLKKKCGLRQKTISKDQRLSIATPHARRCLQAGGLPVVGDLKLGAKEWQKNKTLCFDRLMKSFIDTKTLVELEPNEIEF